jgi:hypothetical protein
MYPAGTRRGELKTVRDLLASQDLDKLFGSRTPRYREQFRKIAEHEDILDSDLGDRDVHNKLLASQARAWNWMGFFLTVFWAAYWRLPTAWVVVGLIIVIDITAQLTGFEIGATLGSRSDLWDLRQLPLAAGSRQKCLQGNVDPIYPFATAGFLAAGGHLIGGRGLTDDLQARAVRLEQKKRAWP